MSRSRYHPSLETGLSAAHYLHMRDAIDTA
jgi:hypothetical protein